MELAWLIAITADLCVIVAPGSGEISKEGNKAKDGKDEEKDAEEGENDGHR